MMDFVLGWEVIVPFRGAGSTVMAMPRDLPYAAQRVRS